MHKIVFILYARETFKGELDKEKLWGTTWGDSKSTLKIYSIC